MATSTGRLCDRCGFDNGEQLGDSGRCAGCGIPLGPADDHDPPAPGFRVREDDPAHVVTDADRERYPDALAGVVAVRRLAYEWGDGVGAAPYGYFTRSRVQVVELGTFEGGRIDLPDECPECGHDRAVWGFHQDRAGIAWSESAECLTCEATLASDRGA